MNLTSNIIINTFSILLLMIIYVHNRRHAEKEPMSSRLYKQILFVVILLLIVDIFSRFDGNPGTFYPFVNYWGNFFIFLLSPVIPSLWILFAHHQIFHDESKTSRLLYPLAAMHAVHAALLVLSQLFGWYYSIDSENIYHRGPLYWLPVSITISLLLASFVLIALNRKLIEKRYYYSLLFFAVPPFLSIILQIAIYGISLMLNSIVLSMLIVFFNIQDSSMHTDYLTGINNRKRLETYMRGKISASNEERTFSAILLDLNNFKTINDTFGHDVGDDALAVSAKLLSSCIRSNDFIARFGGDEFYIVLESSNRQDLEMVVRRIENCVEKYNLTSTKPYTLGFSMGYAVYDFRATMKLEDFQKQIDILMYDNKRSHKEIVLSPG